MSWNFTRKLFDSKFWRRQDWPDATCISSTATHFFVARYDFQLPVANVSYELNSEGISITSRLGSRRVRWADVVAAGAFAPLPGFPALAARPNVLPDVVPGFAGLAMRAVETLRETDRFWIAARSWRRRLLYLSIPHGAEGERMLAELRGYVGDRWRTDPVADSRALRREFHVSNWWIYPLLLLIVLGGLLVLLLAAVSWALLQAAVVMLARRFWPVLLIVVFFAAARWLYRHLRNPGMP